MLCELTRLSYPAYMIFGVIPAILLRRCPSCRRGKVYENHFRLKKLCAHCGYDFYPEPGFYLGAMMVPYVFSAITTVPFAIFLKVTGVVGSALVAPLAWYYLCVVSLLLCYSKTFWLHLEFRISQRQQKLERPSSKS